MDQPSIVIPAGAEMLRAYEAATPEEKRRMQSTLQLWLRELAARESRSLEQIMDEVAANAKAQGMTPEVLESILKGE